MQVAQVKLELREAHAALSASHTASRDVMLDYLHALRDAGVCRMRESLLWSTVWDHACILYTLHTLATHGCVGCQKVFCSLRCGIVCVFLQPTQTLLHPIHTCVARRDARLRTRPSRRMGV